MQSFTYRTCVATTSHSALKNLNANIESCTCKLLFCIFLIQLLPQILCFFFFHLSHSLSTLKCLPHKISRRTFKETDYQQNKIRTEDTDLLFEWKADFHFEESQNPRAGGKEHEIHSQHDRNQCYEREMIPWRCYLIIRWPSRLQHILSNAC